MTLPATYFDRLYDSSADPWGFASRWYEQRKRAATSAALLRERYRDVFEPGCSVGVLTAELAGRCDRLLAADVSATALRLAGERVAGRPGVELARLAVPDEWPSGRRFDLVVVSELGYYLDLAALDRLADLAAESLAEDGELLLCHWRHPVADYPLGGDEVHQRVRGRTGLTAAVSHVERDFVLEVLTRSPDRSVGRDTGLVR